MKQHKMWHEARKQEKKIRGMMVDYKKRAERRREYYERIKKDPAQFLQVHGRVCKIHIDPAIVQAAEGPVTMMPWQGNADTMIDRFDVRAHLDIIPEYKALAEPPKLTVEESKEDRQCNYERYRTLVLNDFIGVSETKFLNQIYLEERYGVSYKSNAEEEKKKLADKKAAIGYVYEDSDPPLPSASSRNTKPPNNTLEDLEEEDDDKEDLSDIDLDVAIDVSQLNNEQGKEMNQNGHKYGMLEQDFISFLYQDKEEAEQLKLAKELEEEKALFSGRKSRRERRALRDKKLQNRKVTSPPSYAARKSPTYKPFRMQLSLSRSPTPENAGQITFITSFGGDHSDTDPPSPPPPRPSSSSIGPQLPERKRKKRSASSDTPRRKSPSSSPSSSKSRSSPARRSRSRSKPLPSPPRKTYYRRSLSKSSDDTSAEEEDSSQSSKLLPSIPKVALAGKAAPSPKMTPQERLKKKMQLALNKHYKADKKAELEKREKQKQELQERADELRDMALKLRQKERERRHKFHDDSDSEEDSRGSTRHHYGGDDAASNSSPERRGRSPSPDEDRPSTSSRHHSSRHHSSGGYRRRYPEEYRYHRSTRYYEDEDEDGYRRIREERHHYRYRSPSHSPPSRTRYYSSRTSRSSRYSRSRSRSRTRGRPLVDY